MSGDGDQAAKLSAALRAHQGGDLREAERLYRSVLQEDPRHAAALNRLGILAAQTRRPDLAAELIGRAVEVEPDNPEYRYNAGLAAQERGDRATAIAAYRRALEQAPDYADALANLGNLLLAEGQADEGERHLRRAIELRPRHPGYRCNLGSALLARHRLREAEACFRAALESKPDLAEAHNGLALALGQLGQFAEAVASFQEALRIWPRNPTVLTNFGHVLFEEDRLDEAERCYRDALRAKPDHVQASLKLARLLVERDAFDEAHRIYDQVLQVDPESTAAWAGKAETLDHQRQTEASDEIVRRFVTETMVPARFAGLYGQVASRSGNQAEAVGRLLRTVDGADLRPDDRRRFHFALGQLYDELESYDEAFTQYAQANALRPTDYDPEQTRRSADDMIAFFDPARLRALPRATNRSGLPVFIVGMPRSGTSLVEQILSCHPQVFGAGELNDIRRISETLLPALFGKEDAAGPLDRERLDQAADAHLDRLGNLGQGAERVTDKMPFNFWHLGLITLLFPGARVIHCLRNPLDTCLSCYFQSFARGNLYSFDLRHAGVYYRQYRRLMDHWRENLDLPILEVHYEEHVGEPERVCRDMQAFLDLEWDPACLDFHDSRRTVRTASRGQVRKPVYASSVDRWRNYERHLGPLIEALGDLA
jgi:tetratricopeptide (TPR) repeat protein